MKYLYQYLIILAILVVFPVVESAAEIGVVPDFSSVKKPEKQTVVHKTWTEPNSGMEFVWLEPGCFQMGQVSLGKSFLLKKVGQSEFTKYYGDELPRHQVCLDGFWIGKYEVTQGQWQKIMGDNGAYFKKGDNYPLDTVSWEEAQIFLRKMSQGIKDGEFHLPTEAEWEYAARGGSETVYSFGDSISTQQANYNGLYVFGFGRKEIYRKAPMPVGSFPANNFGLYDMHGNVWEWCNDWYGEDYYRTSPEKNPVGPEDGDMRVLRGGSWFHYAGNVRSATRYKNDPAGEFGDTGFRVVKVSVGARKGQSASGLKFDPDF